MLGIRRISVFLHDFEAKIRKWGIVQGFSLNKYPHKHSSILRDLLGRKLCTQRGKDAEPRPSRGPAVRDYLRAIPFSRRLLFRKSYHIGVVGLNCFDVFTKCEYPNSIVPGPLSRATTGPVGCGSGISAHKAARVTYRCSSKNTKEAQTSLPSSLKCREVCRRVMFVALLILDTACTQAERLDALPGCREN